jgi:hypothetical protein
MINIGELKKKLVTIIIINYNNYTLTINCVDSLKKQSYRCFKLIIVDNSLNKNKLQKFQIEIEKYRKFFDIDIIINKQNLYFAAGCNKALKNAKTQYICLLNNDTIVESKFIEKNIKFMETHPDAGMITPKIKVLSKKEHIWNAGSIINNKSFFVVKHRGLMEYDPLNQKYNSPEIIEFAPATAMFIRKSLLDIVGLMDEIYFMYFEDLDWNIRAHKLYFKSYYLPSTIVYHDISEKINLFLWYFLIRNSQIFIWKHAKKTNLILFYFDFARIQIKSILYELISNNFISFSIRIIAIFHGLKAGMKRRFNINISKELRKHYYFARKIQNLYYK